MKIDVKIEEMFASRKRVTDVAQPVSFKDTASAMAAAGSQPIIGPGLVQAPSASNQQKLELAKKLASQINMARNLGPEADNTQQVAAAILRGDMAAAQISVRLSDFTLFTLYLCFQIINSTYTIITLTCIFDISLWPKLILCLQIRLSSPYLWKGIRATNLAATKNR